MALGLDGDALDRSRYAGSRQRLPTTEGSQATSNTTCRSGSTPEQKLTPRRHCSPSQRRLISILAATASQCSTNRRDIPGAPPHHTAISRTPGHLWDSAQPRAFPKKEVLFAGMDPVVYGLQWARQTDLHLLKLVKQFLVAFRFSHEYRSMQRSLQGS